MNLLKSKKGLSFVTSSILSSLAFLTSTSIKASPKSLSDIKNADKQIIDLISKMTFDEKIKLLGGAGLKTRGIPRLGIPEVYMADGPMGIRGKKATALVASIALTASWNKKLAKIYGDIIGKECRAYDIGFILGPAVNIYRLPQNGRNFEYMGEDPYLASKMVVPVINGIQQNNVIATIKHLVANNQDYDRHRCNSIVSERALREIYLPAFKAGVKEANVGAIMTAYNHINGEHASGHRLITHDILRNEWGFKGILMSDWGGSYYALPMLKYGIDLEMGHAFQYKPNRIKALLNSQKVTIFNIDQKVYHIISTCKKFGIYNYSIKRQDKNNQKSSKTQTEGMPILVNNDKITPSGEIDYKANHKKALKIAHESIVLLKNENNILPLSCNNNKTIAVIGRNAINTPSSGGGAANVTPYRYIDNLDAIKKAFPKANVNYIELNPLNKFLTESNIPQTSWTYNLYKNMNLDNKNIVYSQKLNKVTDKITVPKSTKYNSHHVAQWETNFQPKTNATLTIAARCETFFRVRVNGKVVIDQWKSRKYLPAVYQYFGENFAVNYDFEANKKYKIQIETHNGNSWNKKPNQNKISVNIGLLPSLNKEKEIIKSSDIVIANIGLNSFIEGEGHDRSFALPEQEEKIMSLATSLNDNIITIINAGGGIRMTNWVDKSKAILMAWYQGQAGGQAVADILTGKVNPSAKLPISIEREWKDSAAYDSYNAKRNTKITFNTMVRQYHQPVPEYYKEGIFVGYRHFDKNKIEPLFPFGYGLSYSKFKYSNIQLSADAIKRDQTLTVKCNITNTSKVTGAEIVQLYINDEKARLARPVKELKGFEKVFLKPNETKVVTFKVTLKDLQFFDDLYKQWVAENGRFNILIGSSSRDIKLKASFDLK